MAYVIGRDFASEDEGFCLEIAVPEGMWVLQGGEIELSVMNVIRQKQWSDDQTSKLSHFIPNYVICFFVAVVHPIVT